MNKPTARRRKVIVRKPKSTTRPMFFLSEAMLKRFRFRFRTVPYNQLTYNKRKVNMNQMIR